MMKVLLSLCLAALVIQCEAMFAFTNKPPPTTSRPTYPPPRGGGVYQPPPPPPPTTYNSGASSRFPDGGYDPKPPAVYSPNPPPYQPPTQPPTYNPPSHGSGYPPNNGDYPNDQSFGNNFNYGNNYQPPLPPPAHNPHDGPLDLLDKLWERVNDVEKGNKFAAEQIDALDARLSLLKLDVDDLTFIVFPRLHRADENQNNELNNLDKHLDTLKKSLDDLHASINWLEQQNQHNRNNITALENSYAAEKSKDTVQDGSVANLHVAVKDFKSKLFVVLKNEFELFNDQVETTSGKLDNTKKRAATRLCETGTVTLSGDDRRAEYVFQTHFDLVPGVIYSITGFNANLDARDQPVIKYGSYGPPPKEPNAIGILVAAYATKKDIVFQAVDLSFGDTEAFTVDVDFQACTIGPGSDLADHKPKPH